MDTQFDDIFTQYGPFSYILRDFIYRAIPDLSVTHDTNRMISLIFWLFRVLSGRRSQIEFPTVEVDGVDEVLLIAETARRGLDPLNP